MTKFNNKTVTCPICSGTKIDPYTNSHCTHCDDGKVSRFHSDLLKWDETKSGKSDRRVLH